MKKNQLIGLVLVAVIIGSLAIFLLPKVMTEKEPAVTQTAQKVYSIDMQTDAPSDFNNPARYAFVTDKYEPKLAVVDMFSRKAVQNIALKTIAERIGISKVAGFIAYAKRGEQLFYRLDLTSLEQKPIAVKQPINDLVVHGDGKWVAYSSNNSVNIVTMRSGKEVNIATQGNTSILYHPSNDSLFIAELEHGRLQRVALKDSTQQTLFDLGKPMSPISVMPNGMAVFFVADGIIHRYSLLDEGIIPLNINALTFRPYITSDSRMILALSHNVPAELLTINAYTYQVEARFPLKKWQQSPDNLHDFVMTGWLEQVAVLVDEQAFYSLTFNQADSLTLKDSKNHKGAVRDMLVQSDSKTLLLTRDDSQQLGIFDMKSQQFAEGVALNLAQPDHVLMGETNTLCH